MTKPIRLFALSLLLACSACSKPEPPKKDQPPEPQAEQNTELRDLYKDQIDKAKAVEPEVLEAAKQQQADIDAQAGN